MDLLPTSARRVSKKRKQRTGTCRIFILNVSQPINHRNNIDVSSLFPVIVLVGDISDFQLGVLENFVLNRQIPLPGVGHLVRRSIGQSWANRDPLRSNWGCRPGIVLLHQALVQVPAIPVWTVKGRIEGWIVTCDLQRPQAIAVEVLASTSSNRPFSVSGGIPSDTKTGSDHVIVVIHQRPVRTRHAACTSRAWIRAQPG